MESCTMRPFEPGLFPLTRLRVIHAIAGGGGLFLCVAK